MSTALHDKPASSSAEYRGRPAADFGDVRGEFEALISACGIYALSGRAKIAINGADRVRWLNGMITNNIRELAAGRGVYAFLLNPQGHILGDLYAYNRGESIVADTDHSQLEKVITIFKKYIIMDKVTLEDVGEKLTTIGIAGPKAHAVMQSAGLEVPTLQPLQLVDRGFHEIRLTLVRGDPATVECFELWLDPANVPAVWQALVRAGARPGGTTAQELLRIASGIPRYGQDIRERDLPQETGQQRALHFSKGCYIGQEIVERIRSRGGVHRQLTGFEIDGPLPAPGTKLQADGKEVGEITSVASLPSAPERAIALGYIRREAAIPGKELGAGSAKVRVANLPFAGVFKS